MANVFCFMFPVGLAPADVQGPVRRDQDRDHVPAAVHVRVPSRVPCQDRGLVPRLKTLKSLTKSLKLERTTLGQDAWKTPKLVLM